MTTLSPVSRDKVTPATQQGGEIRILLSPLTTGATSGFLGTLDLAPGEYVAGHYHPYSDESLYVVRGTLTVQSGDSRFTVSPDEALLLPREVPHRFTNDGTEPVFVVFHIGPLAPSPELGHVNIEPVPRPEAPHPVVGGPTS